MKNLLVCAALATSMLSVTACASTSQNTQIKPNVSSSGASVATIPVLTGEMAQNMINAAALEAKKTSGWCQSRLLMPLDRR